MTKPWVTFSKKLVALTSISITVLFGSLASAQSEGPHVNLVEALTNSPELQSGQAELILCFSNRDLADDLTSPNPYLNRIFNSLYKADPMAIQDLKTEVCVRPKQVLNDKKSILELKSRMGRIDHLNLEITTLTRSFNYEQFGPDKSTTLQPIHITLRGAAAGALAALVVDKSRAGLDYLSNKGKHGQSVTLAQGAAIGAVTDIIQGLLGVTDTKQRQLNDAGAAGIGTMLQTKDPNVIGLAVALTLSQIPAVSRLTDRIADATPKVLSWEIPVAMTGIFYLLGKRQKDTELAFNKDKALGAATFGTLSAAVAISKKNETAGFIVASFASLIDEVCDSISRSCQGRFDWNDLAANTIGAYMGAKLGGFFLAKDQTGKTRIYYMRQW